jgi:uncharacterized protein (TIGR03067 family)
MAGPGSALNDDRGPFRGDGNWFSLGLFNKGRDMRLANAVVVLCAVGFIAADEPKKDDAEALKGNWSAISFQQGGRAAPDDLIKKFKASFDGKNYKNLVDGQVLEEGGYTIDASKTPKTIDFDIRKGDGEGKKQLAVFQLEGNKLTLVVAEPGSTDRPKSMKTEKTDPFIELVLERAKP